MVSYLLFVGIFITLGVVGFMYGILSDTFDIIQPISQQNTYTLQHLSATDTNWVGDLLTFIAKLSPVWVVIGVFIYAMAKSQKPEVPY